MFSNMAAPMATHVRVKVFFENNEFDASWLLIDTSDLRTMKDVQRYISLKFLGKTVPLYLTLQGCFLPDWEKSVILRDNDCINAKCVHQDSFENQTILLAPADEDEENRRHNKKKKKKDKNVHSLSLQSIDQHEADGVKSSNHQSEISHGHDLENERDIEKNGSGNHLRKQLSDSNLSIKSKLHDNQITALKNQFEQLPVETSSGKHKHKKKKHKHDKSKLEETTKSDKSRKRKIDIGENNGSMVFSTSIEEPKKMKKIIDTPNVEFDPNSKTNGIQDEQDLSVNKATTSVNVKGENVEPRRKRKRIRKRKRKNMNDSVPEKSQLESCNASFNKTWNWGTGHSLNEMSNDLQKKQHKVFQSDQSENESESKNKDEMDSTDTYNYTKQTNIDEDFNNVEGQFLEKSESSDICDEKENHIKNKNTEYTHRDTSPETGQPSLLATSYLTNGVAVYSRNRKQNLRQYAELSKEAQLNTKLTNVSVVIQNTSHAENEKSANPDQDLNVSYEAEPVDHTKFVALIGPPRVGDRLAYKVIELSEDYTPEVSNYKEAVVCSFNPVSKLVELENQQEEKRKNRADGKFEVVFEDEEYSDVSQIKICLPLESLIEPKLLT